MITGKEKDMKEFGYEKQYDVIVAGGGVCRYCGCHRGRPVWERMS